jgi:hypothetical protein
MLKMRVLNDFFLIRRNRAKLKQHEGEKKRVDDELAKMLKAEPLKRSEVKPKKRTKTSRRASRKA